MCGEAHILINFVYEIDFSVAYLIYVLISFLIYLSIVNNICDEQKGTECV